MKVYKKEKNFAMQPSCTETCDLLASISMKLKFLSYAIMLDS